MQAITLDLNNSIVGSGDRPVGADIKLSLRPFIAYVGNMANTAKNAKINYYKYILEQFKQFPELQEPIPKENVHRYNVLFELIYTALSPIINEEKEHLWAISTPLLPCFHYGTNACSAAFIISRSLQTSLPLSRSSIRKQNCLSITV
jgi:hypothetical protein